MEIFKLSFIVFLAEPDVMLFIELIFTASIVTAIADSRVDTCLDLILTFTVAVRFHRRQPLAFLKFMQYIENETSHFFSKQITHIQKASLICDIEFRSRYSESKLQRFAYFLLFLRFKIFMTPKIFIISAPNFLSLEYYTLVVNENKNFRKIKSHYMA